MRKLITPSKTMRDPVCHMSVDPDMTDLRVDHEGQSYYFCAEACHKSFEMNPEKFLPSHNTKRKGWWGRYLERLAKAQKRGTVTTGHCH